MLRSGHQYRQDSSALRQGFLGAKSTIPDIIRNLRRGDSACANRSYADFIVRVARTFIMNDIPTGCRHPLTVGSPLLGMPQNMLSCFQPELGH